jgi:hypothetical protein
LIERVLDWRDRFRPIDYFVGQTLPGAIAIQRDIGAGCYENVFPVRESQDVSYITGPFTLMFSDCGNGEQFTVWPIEDNGQSAQIINVAAQVGIYMQFGHGVFLRS